jgi:hypothetical protein
MRIKRKPKYMNKINRNMEEIKTEIVEEKEVEEVEIPTIITINQKVQTQIRKNM